MDSLHSMQRIAHLMKRAGSNTTDGWICLRRGNGM